MASSRYIPHSKAFSSDLDKVRHDVEAALAAAVQRVHRHISSRPGVYVGGAGVILMDWSLDDFSTELPVLKETPAPSAFSLSEIETGGRASFLETSVGLAALTLADHLHRNAPEDLKVQETCALLIRDAIRVAIEEDVSDDGCEVLYGRAGLLYALLFLRAEAQAHAAGSQATGDDLVRHPLMRLLGQLCSDKNINALVHDIVARGRTGATLYKEGLRSPDREGAPPLMWSWHGKRYLGGAHGVVGILQMLVSVPHRIIAPYWDMIMETVAWLLGIQQPCGNWPHKAGREMHDGLDEDEADQLIQWCHGAPAVLILLSTLITRFGSLASTSTSASSPALTLSHALEDAARSALARGGKVVYEHGFLRKGVGLCHGVAGSVYALLAVSAVLDARTPEQKTSDRTWFLRAAHLAQLATGYEMLTKKGEMSIPDRPYSLYEGLAGMCCAWAEVLRRIEGPGYAGRGMPGYSDLPYATE